MDSYIDKDKNISILGTNDGKIYRIINGQRSLIYTDEYNSEVRAIRKLSENVLVIGFMSGNVITLKDYHISNSSIKIRKGNNSKYTRLYALEILDNDTIYFSGNYGEISKLFKEDNNWISIQVKKFHGSGAIFCLENLKDTIFISCDYSGGVVIWEVKDKIENILYKINTFGNIQCVSCSDDMNRLAMVHRSGMFLIFQKSGDQYNLILEHEYPKNSGKKIIYLEADNSFIFNTKYKLYRYLQGTLYESNIIFTGNIEKIQEKAYYINSSNSINSIEGNEFNAIDRLQKSKLLNVGLIGHTGVGKSTLCDKFCDIFKFSDLSSTSHRKLWIYQEADDKFIFFNDIAGQLELIPTLLPSLKRSDIILGLFKSNDSLTFEILKKYVHMLRIQYKFSNKIFLIRTFYNDNNLDSSHADLIDEERITEFIDKYNLEPVINIDRDDIDSLESFITKFKNSIEWENIKDWILSIQQKVFINYLKNYLEKDLSVATLTEICRMYDDLDEEPRQLLNNMGFFGFDRSAVKSLLMRYKEKELIDVIRSDDLILILNSKLFRNIKARFYKSAKEKKGFVNLSEIKTYFFESTENFEDIELLDKYISYYDEEFLFSNTWLENKKDQRIFWSLITNENLDNPRAIIQNLKEKQNGQLEKFTIDLKTQINLSFKQEKLCNLEFLIELLNNNLIAKELSKTKGYWTNKDKSLELYYAFLDNEESTIITYYLFSNSENHNIALKVDNFFRFYFLDIYEEVAFNSRSMDYIVNDTLYSEFVRTKKTFFNSNLESTIVKYKKFNEPNEEKKILIIYSNPIDVESIGSESEILKIKQILEEIKYNRNKYRILPHCSLPNLKSELDNYNPEICYYSGHSDEISIYFENKVGLIDKCDALEFIKMIETTNIDELYLNSCRSKFILDLKTKTKLKCIGYDNKVPDFQARKLGINFFIFHLRYGMDFYKAIDLSKEYAENQEKVAIIYIQKS